MADYIASAFQDPSKPQRTVDEKGARLRCSPSHIVMAAVAALNDRILFAKIPSRARVVDVGKFSYAAFGGTSAMSLGFWHEKMTSGEATAAASKLFAAQTVVAAGSRQVMAGVALADLNKRVWQLAGLTADPGGEMWVLGTVTTAFTAGAGDIHCETTYTND